MDVDNKERNSEILSTHDDAVHANNKASLGGLKTLLSCETFS